ncbi:hypothetical protein [Streptomyces sparsogenes]|uniref:Uncharacterized protein n=1 Tax=Streptomyces sparsogenes DSM 40356 TaxID=1331668 RepID=A0A1R1S5M3_9ACTN|nr:hypothetical protein [Streptomyces sparsogenes]OMI33558.1 hypothetical protein SPAR_40787 [Streptomyces sparsogenes DSM 40356]
MDIPDRLSSLRQIADAEYAKLAGLIGDEHEAQWKRWRDAAIESQAAVTEHAKEAGKRPLSPPPATCPCR